VNIVSLFITYAQATPGEEPFKARFDDVAEFPQSAAVLGVATRNQWPDATLSQRLANLGLRIVRAVAEQFIRAFARSAARLFDRWNFIDQGNGHLRIMAVCARVRNGQRRPLTVDYQMALRAILASIRRIGASFRPPKSARTEQLSMADVDQSIWSANPSSSRRSFHTCFQTPAKCQSRSRRQHVMPHPQPNSGGRYSHGQPVLNTKRMPVNAARSGTRGRPPLGLGGSGGSNGLIRSQSASGNSGLAMMSSLTYW
jgi:hypothetical protein